MDMGLQGKVAVVTGGALTLGREIAMALSAEGARIAIADLKEDESKGVADQIIAGGGEALAVKTDVSKGAQVEAMVERVIQTFGAIDVLVNNAGILGPQGPWGELSEEGFDQVVGVNIKGVYLCSKAVAGHMTAQKSGKIVNIASIAGKTGEPFNGVYAVTKTAVISLTQSLALELAPHSITVNAVCPAALKDSEIMERVYRERSKWLGMTPDELRTHWKDGNPLPYEVAARDVADMVVFLASEKTRNVTGAAINVSGGVEVH